ncbi:hypothetical protein ACHHYP_15529 [Achlya hypogyna]|uniref:Uncharacterized protein n=1 Tax=Achlya hypogyna TaxID=1202772 RepID=A0A1V9YAP2_ACHHY|nr:hypothetical protein ACHHYP_15529 [Achlya hypogyna]
MALADLEKLRIEPQPPRFPFVDKPFEVVVYLVGGAGDLKTGTEMPLRVDLFAGDKKCNELLRVATPALVDGSGICKLRLAILAPSSDLGNRPFTVAIAPEDPTSTVAPVVSSEMVAVRHHLVVQNALPDVWYKDEGSRDKCLEFAVHLVDHSGALVQSRVVPLRISLVYDNGVTVFKQDILKVAPESQRCTDPAGRALVKVRIEDVSRNHQSQPFRLLVAPDGLADVAPDRTTPVTVRSKRNKRPAEPRPAELVSADDSGDAASSASASPPRWAREKRPRLAADSTIGRVLSWTRSVLQALELLEWQQVGFEIGRDGAADFGRPLYRCPSCWRYKDALTFESQQHAPHCGLATLLLTYATETVHDFETLVHTLQVPSPERLPPWPTPAEPECGVFCVLAQLAVLEGGACAGFPAFDSALALVGFYQAITTTTTAIIFCPVDAVLGLSGADVAHLQTTLHQALFDNSPALFRTDAFGGDLERLKERALLYFWESNVPNV